MRAVRAHCELQLEPQLVDVLLFCIIRMPVLRAKLREFTGPVGQDERAALINLSRIAGTRDDENVCSEQKSPERIDGCFDGLDLGCARDPNTAAEKRSDCAVWFRFK